MAELRERMNDRYSRIQRDRREKWQGKRQMGSDADRFLQGDSRKIRGTFDKREGYNMLRGTVLNLLIAGAGIFPAMAVAFTDFAPFGLSYLATENYKSWRFYLTYIVVCIGSMLANGVGGAIKYIAAASIYGLSLVILSNVGNNAKRYPVFLTGSVMAVSLFLSGVVLMYFSDLSVGGILLLICECLAELTVALMLECGREMWTEKLFTLRKINDEQKLSIIVFGAIVLLSIKGFRIGSFGLSDYTAALAVLIAAVSCGAGQATVMGVILGIICAIGTDDFLQLVGVFGFSGFMAGFMAKNKKIGAVVGIVIANTVLTVYINGALENNLSILELALASATLFIIPPKVFVFFKTMFITKTENEIASRRMMEMIKIKLARISESFSELSAVIKQAADRNKLNSGADVSEMFDRVADKVCRSCKNSALCWISEFNATYQTMFKLLETLEVRGEINGSDVSEFFSNRCIKLGEFLRVMNNQFEVYKTTGIWKSRMRENREVITLQLGEVAQIIKAVNEYMKNDISCNSMLAKNLEEGFEMRGIDCRNISVIANSKGRVTACTEVKRSALMNIGEEKLSAIIGGMLGKRVSLTNRVDGDTGVWSRAEFEEEPIFRLDTGIASSSASEFCGDSVKCSRLSDGRAVIILSDGMGTGRRAASESEMVVRLLMRLLESGFEPINAVRLVNSVMLMLTESSSFATVDVCVMDLYTGAVKLIKTGAEPSYIKRGSELEIIKAHTLPIGMMADAEAEEFETRLDEGDMLIMITDGVESKQTGDAWLQSFIADERVESDAEDMANRIICRAYSELLSDADDDMTAVTVKLVRN